MRFSRQTFEREVRYNPEVSTKRMLVELLMQVVLRSSYVELDMRGTACMGAGQRSLQANEEAALCGLKEQGI